MKNIKKKRYWVMGIIAVSLIGIVVVGVSYPGSNTSPFTGPVSAKEPLPNALIADKEKTNE